jgi:metal-dependent amidase/aminoacylase/carboxypeptidase family protein
MPFKWGEDFGLFTQNFKGAFFGLGAGKDQPALHNPDYDFPDELIPTGAQLFYELCKNHLVCP